MGTHMLQIIGAGLLLWMVLILIALWWLRRWCNNLDGSDKP